LVWSKNVSVLSEKVFRNIHQKSLFDHFLELLFLINYPFIHPCFASFLLFSNMVSTQQVPWLALLLHVMLYGCYLVIFLNRASIFDLCVNKWVSKNKHHKDTCLKENGPCLQYLLTWVQTCNHGDLGCKCTINILAIDITQTYILIFSLTFEHNIPNKSFNSPLEISRCGEACRKCVCTRFYIESLGGSMWSHQL